MKVVISKELVKAHPNYANSQDCPLWHALKEQHPEFKFEGISSVGMVRLPNCDYISPTTGRWNGKRHAILSGDLEENNRKWINDEFPEGVPNEIVLEYNVEESST